MSALYGLTNDWLNLGYQKIEAEPELMSVTRRVGDTRTYEEFFKGQWVDVSKEMRGLAITAALELKRLHNQQRC